MMQRVISYIRSLLRDGAATIDLSSPKQFYASLRMLYVFRAVRRHTQVRIPRLKILYRLVQDLDLKNISGDIVECGVRKGGSAAVLAYASRHAKPARTIWMFDSFEGEPPPTKEDAHDLHDRFREGWCKGAIDDVRGICARLGIPPSRYRIVPGWFEDSFPHTPTPKHVALLHLDADMYESTRLCLEKFGNALPSGGYIICNGYEIRPGVQKAMREFILKTGTKLDSFPIDNIGRYFKKNADT